MNKLMTIGMMGLLLVPAYSSAYNNTVHYFLTVVVTENIDPVLTDNEKRLVSFCAQLPDETEEYDAMRQYQKLLRSGSYWQWANIENDSEEMQDILSDSDDARELVTVQQLLHGLTGGNAREMLVTADSILEMLMIKVRWAKTHKEKATNLCAVGFAVHLLGDTLAHRRLNSGGLEAEGRMYSTGKGHAFDGKKPDNLIKSVTGLDGIKRYNNKIPLSLPDNRTLGKSGLRDLELALEAASNKWFWKEAAARRAILAETPDWAVNNLVEPDNHANESCQQYVNRVVPILAPDQCVPDCEEVFDRFAQIAQEKFASSHESRMPALSAMEYFYPDVKGVALVCSDANEPAR